MDYQPARDVPLLIVSAQVSSERRVTPSWTLTQLRSKLESITGVPPSCQQLTLKLPGQGAVGIEAQDEDTTRVGAWNLQAYAEIQVGHFVLAGGACGDVTICPMSLVLAMPCFSIASWFLLALPAPYCRCMSLLAI